MITEIRKTRWGWILKWCAETPKREEIAKRVGTDNFEIRLRSRDNEFSIVDNREGEK